MKKNKTNTRIQKVIGLSAKRHHTEFITPEQIKEYKKLKDSIRKLGQPSKGKALDKITDREDFQIELRKIRAEKRERTIVNIQAKLKAERSKPAKARNQRYIKSLITRRQRAELDQADLDSYDGKARYTIEYAKTKLALLKRTRASKAEIEKAQKKLQRARDTKEQRRPSKTTLLRLQGGVKVTRDQITQYGTYQEKRNEIIKKQLEATKESNPRLYAMLTGKFNSSELFKGGDMKYKPDLTYVQDDTIPIEFLNQEMYEEKMEHYKNIVSGFETLESEYTKKTAHLTDVFLHKITNEEKLKQIENKKYIKVDPTPEEMELSKIIAELDPITRFRFYQKYKSSFKDIYIKSRAHITHKDNEAIVLSKEEHKEAVLELTDKLRKEQELINSRIKYKF